MQMLERHHHAEPAAFHDQCIAAFPTSIRRSTSWSFTAWSGGRSSSRSRRCSRYPMVTRMHFVECAGNSAPMFSPRADPGDGAGAARPRLLRGMDRRAALDPAGRGRHRSQGEMARRRGRRSLAVSRSVPMKKAYDDAMVAIYQNGERLMPGNGYPMRLLVPGYQGNMNVKFLRRLKAVDQPAMTYFETKNYSQMLPGGKTWRFHFLMRGEELHHPALVRPEPQGAGLLRDLRHRLFGQRAHRQGHGLGRRRQELGRGRARRAGQRQGLHPLPHAVALGRPAGGADEPRLGRGRQRAAAARRVRRRARREPRSRADALAFPNQHYNSITGWGIEPKGRSSMSTRKPPPPVRLALAFAAVGAPPPKARTSASRSPRPTSRTGTSPCCPTAPTCRPAAARPPKAPRSTPRNASAATARRQGRRRPAAGRRPAAAPTASTRRRRSPTIRPIRRRCSTGSGAPCPTPRRAR